MNCNLGKLGSSFLIWLAFLGMASAQITIDGSFSDWSGGNEFCVDDQDQHLETGSNAINPSRGDVTQFCVATDTTTEFYFRFGLDDTNFTSNQTSCILIDSEATPDTFFNFAVCITVNGTNGLTVSFRDCNNTSSTSCGNSTQNDSKTTTLTSNSARGSAPGPFPLGGTDTFVELSVSFADLGITTGKVILSDHRSFAGVQTSTLVDKNLLDDTRVSYSTSGSGFLSTPTAVTLVSGD